MEHTFFCEQCGKRFDVDASLIGKRARCKDCKHVFIVPGQTSRPAPFDPFRREEPAYKNPYGLEGLEVHPPRLGRPTPEVRKKRRRSSGDENYQWVRSVTLCLAIAGGVFLVMLLLASLADSEWFAWIGLGGLGGASVCMAVLGSILVLVTSFRESSLTGLLFLFMPFYPWYYLLTRWGDVKRPAILMFTGMAFCLITEGAGYVWLKAVNPQLLQRIVDQANGKADPGQDFLPEPFQGQLAAGPAQVPGNPFMNPPRGAGPGPMPGPLNPDLNRAQAQGEAQGPGPAPGPAAPRFRPQPWNPGPFAQRAPANPDPLPPAEGGARNRLPDDDRPAQAPGGTTRPTRCARLSCWALPRAIGRSPRSREWGPRLSRSSFPTSEAITGPRGKMRATSFGSSAPRRACRNSP